MEQGALNCSTGLGTLSVNGVAMQGPAWCVYDLSALLDDAEIRGGDRLIPHAVGVLARQRRRTVRRYDFPMLITGLYTRLGVRNTDRYMGLITNVEYLKANLGIGTVSTTGTVTATWTRLDASTKSAQVHVLTPMRVQHVVKGVATAVLSLSVPAGVFS